MFSRQVQKHTFSDDRKHWDAQPELNPENTQHSTADIYEILRIIPDLFRWRVLSGKYPEVKTDGRRRLFTLEVIDKLVQIRPELNRLRLAAAKERWKKSSPG
jgi:hypothetical protein